MDRVIQRDQNHYRNVFNDHTIFLFTKYKNSYVSFVRACQLIMV